jgi:acid stress-induced BolA-like protein IbaG/YrbA
MQQRFEPSSRAEPMVNPEQVKAAIRNALPGAEVEVEDLTGGGDHLQVRVVCESFAGLNRVRQHQLVYGALRSELASEAIHALAVHTATP